MHVYSLRDFSWVMTPPAGRVRRFLKSHGSGQEVFIFLRVGSGGFHNLAGRVGSGQKVFESRGSGRIILTRPGSDSREVT